MKRALITGITGQDGSYLAELLLDKGYEVHGLRRRSSSHNTSRLDHLLSDRTLGRRIVIHDGDITDSGSLRRALNEARPREVYNLAAQSHVAVSFTQPEYTAEVDALGTLRLLEAVRATGMTRTARVYQASTSELFGKVLQVPQTETTPFYPRSPYGVAKLFSYWITVNYREAYGMYACNGILFNHESPRRGHGFVTRKITLALARIIHGVQDRLRLGNLDSKRDWGHARDYVEMMWLMLQKPKPADYVVATGRQRTVRQFVDAASKAMGLPLEWRGKGRAEKGVDRRTGRVIVEVDPRYFRPAEVDTLLGDSSKARRELGWKPRRSFEELVEEMAREDLALAAREAEISRRGLGAPSRPR
jgi:GDPmannose 4,6-dehydratase